jgi:hypothetical protein
MVKCHLEQHRIYSGANQRINPMHMEQGKSWQETTTICGKRDWVCIEGLPAV